MKLQNNKKLSLFRIFRKLMKEHSFEIYNISDCSMISIKLTNKFELSLNEFMNIIIRDFDSPWDRKLISEDADKLQYLFKSHHYAIIKLTV